MKRLRQLEQENQRLKKMVADRDLDLDVLKELTETNVRSTELPRRDVDRSVGRDRLGTDRFGQEAFSHLTGDESLAPASQSPRLSPQPVRGDTGFRRPPNCSLPIVLYSQRAA